MKWHEKIRTALYVWWLGIKLFPDKIKQRIWNKHILLWWRRLYIRKDEFHRPLDMDDEAMLEMSEQEISNYRINLVHRRKIAHRRNLAKC